MLSNPQRHNATPAKYTKEDSNTQSTAVLWKMFLSKCFVLHIITQLRKCGINISLIKNLVKRAHFDSNVFVRQSQRMSVFYSLGGFNHGDTHITLAFKTTNIMTDTSVNIIVAISAFWATQLQHRSEQEATLTHNLQTHGATQGGVDVICSYIILRGGNHVALLPVCMGHNSF